MNNYNTIASIFKLTNKNIIHDLYFLNPTYINDRADINLK